MATNYVEKMKAQQTKRPGVLATAAIKRAKWTVLVYLGVCAVMLCLMFAGLFVPGLAWVAPP